MGTEYENNLQEMDVGLLSHGHEAWDTAIIAKPVYTEDLKHDHKSDLNLTVPSIIVIDSFYSIHTLFNEQRMLKENNKHLHTMRAKTSKEFFEKKLTDPSWESIIASLTPVQFGEIIFNVGPVYEQHLVASLLGKVINNGMLSWKYCIEALVNAKEYNRINVIEALLPFCVD